MAFDAVKGSLDPLSCTTQVFSHNQQLRPIRELTLFERDRLLQHKHDLLPVRGLPPRTCRKADVRSTLSLHNRFHSPLIRLIREEFRRALLRWRSLSVRRGVVREECIEPGNEGSDLGWGSVAARQWL